MMRVGCRWIKLAALAASVFVVQSSGFAASVENGKRVFMRVGCWQCHGTMGQGGVTGPKLAPGPLPFEALSTFVRSTNRAMPAYREQVLSDDDLADRQIFRYSVNEMVETYRVNLRNQLRSLVLLLETVWLSPRADGRPLRLHVALI
jgi:mono/diheme cytochrome c family protein